jgi:hypothetical protein
MAFRIAHSEGRALAPVVYRDKAQETADLYTRFAGWLVGGAA